MKSFHKGWGTALIAALVWSSWLAPASADPPPLLPIQGYLTDSASAPLDGVYQIRFRLYDADTAGTTLFEETLDVTVADGFFTVYLGDTVVLDLELFRDNSDIYLGIRVGTDAEAAPRLQLASTGFASLAAFCGDADTVGGLAPDDLQSRVVGTCGANQFMQTIDAAGTVVCGSAPAETDPAVGAQTAGRWCTSDGTTVTCSQTAPLLTETDPAVGAQTAGRWCTTDGTTVTCTQTAPVLTENDPAVGAQAAGRWCTSDGTTVTCTQTAPVTAEVDPQVGTVADNGLCVGNGSVVDCTGPTPLFSEADPQVGALTAGRWCTTDGTTIACAQTAPVLTEADPQVGTMSNGGWCTSDGMAVNCGQAAPVLSESDPQVGALNANDVPRWSGTALSSSRIVDNGMYVGVGLGAVVPDRMLDVGGDVEVTGAYRFSSARTFSTFISPTSFLTQTDADNARWTRATSGFGHMSEADASIGALGLFADVSLPEDATISGVQCFYQDESTADAIGYQLFIISGGAIPIDSNFSFYRRAQTAETVEQLANDGVNTTAAGTNATPTSSGWLDNTILAGAEVVDNTSYDYYMYVSWAVGNDAVNTLKFYGCRITYTMLAVAFP